MSKDVKITVNGQKNVTVEAGTQTTGTGSGSIWVVQSVSEGLHIASMIYDDGQNPGSYHREITRYFNVTAEKPGVYEFDLLHNGEVDRHYTVQFLPHECFSNPNHAVGG